MILGRYTLEGNMLPPMLTHDLGVKIQDLPPGMWEFVARKPLITSPQMRALHLWFEMIAEALNEAGHPHEYKVAFAERTARIPWTKELVKDFIWRPVQRHLLKKESTTKLTTTEIDKVADPIQDAVEQKTGKNIPFPSEEDLSRQSSSQKK